MRLTSVLTTAASSLALGVAFMAAPAFAQSAGSVDFDSEIVVTGTRGATQAVGGISSPDSANAKAVLTQDNIQRQNPGQTILDTINQIPGVSFQNNDAYGSSGGTLNIRGFSADRISLTFDGIPLNDSGNYAIYSNQQIDPEIIDEVNVNLGTTDVDSPTASAVGGTVNYRSKKPDRDFGAMLSGSAGQFEFMRMFAKVETGDLNASGTRAWASASRATNNNPFNGYGKVNKQQYNAKIYQPLKGDDYVSLAVHYNQNRNNFFGSLPLRRDLTQSLTNSAVRAVGPNANNRFPTNSDETSYTILPCQIDVPQPSVADTTNSCGTEFDRRYNPSNTGNVRLAARFSLADNLVFTVEPSYQWVKANGGGTVTGREGKLTNGTNSITGFVGGAYYFGKDLNGDVDVLDQVILIAPSQTATKRIAVISNLRWDINDTSTLRVGYTYDRARHRQTGEVGTLQINGEPTDVFPINSPLTTSDGFIQQKRDRLSFAILHKAFAEYRGKYFDDALVVTAGVTVPFFKRNLTNHCFTTSAGGNLDCFGRDAATNALYGALRPTIQGPQQRIFNFSKVLPKVGFVYHIDSAASVFASFSQGISVPGTDSLYNAFFFAPGTAGTRPQPETTNNYDAGARYRTGRIQAQVSAYLNQFQNRLASAYDPTLDQNVFRNLGNVRKYGVDGSIAYQPIEQLTFYLQGSVMKSEIRDNIAIGENTDGTPIFAATAGRREGGAATYSWGGSVRGELGPIEVGLTAKRTGPRYIFDNNLPTFQGAFIPLGAKTSTGGTPVLTAAQVASTGEIYNAKAAPYWLVNLDARVNLDFLGLNDKTYFQVNVYNLFNQFYVGGFGGALAQSVSYNKTTGVATYNGPGFVQIGAPRTVSGTVVFKF